MLKRILPLLLCLLLAATQGFAYSARECTDGYCSVDDVDSSLFTGGSGSTASNITRKRMGGFWLEDAREPVGSIQLNFITLPGSGLFAGDQMALFSQSV